MERRKIAIQNRLQAGHLCNRIKFYNVALQFRSARHYYAVERINRVNEPSFHRLTDSHAEAFDKVEAERNSGSDGQRNLQRRSGLGGILGGPSAAGHGNGGDHANEFKQH
jgi:hypothetical protein